MKTPLACLLVSILGALTVPAHAAESLSSAGGTKLTITELAEDGTHAVRSGVAAAPVDARSRITLSFDSTAVAGASDQEARWKALQGVLDEIKELSIQRTAAFSALAAARGSDDETIKAAQRLAYTYTTRFLEFKARVKKILGDDTYKQINDTATKRAREGRSFLQELGEWASKELTALTPSPEAAAQKLPEVQVEIVAFLEPAGFDRKPIHVENYDHLPEGVLKPLTRTGLRISSEEQAKLNQDLEYARQAAQSINEIRQEKDKMARELMNFRNELRSRLQQTVDNASQQVTQLRGRVDSLVRGIDEDKRDALLKAVPALSSTTASLDRIAASITGLRGQLDALNQVRVQDLVAVAAGDSFLPGKVVEQLAALKSGVQDLQPALRAVASQAASNLKTLGLEQQSALTHEVDSLTADATKELTSTMGRLTDALPATKEMVGAWEKMFKATREQAGASGALEQDVPVIRRGLNDLIPATVDLRRAGVKVGDYLSIKVRVREAGGERVLEEKSFDFVIGSMGWHREYTGQLLFASPTSGPSKSQFEANVGVIVTWKYGHRNPVGSAKFMSWLNPGLGIHATSLHQGGSTLEVGSGVAVSLWDNLVTGGYGWNLGVRNDRQYVFVGIGILDLLHKMNTINQPGK